MNSHDFPLGGRKDTKKSKKGLIQIVIGIFLLGAALSLVFYNIWDGRRAKKASDEIVKKLEMTIPDVEPGISGYEELEQEMPVEEIDGYLYIGVLDIPSLGLSLPVMAEWDYVRLKISPCRYYGSYFTDDLVICAHNYAKHFSSVKWIDVGADVYFTAVDGRVLHYQVSNRETIRPAAVEDMINNTKEEWDMTLFTCNTGGQTRCAVRCVKTQ